MSLSLIARSCVAFEIAESGLLLVRIACASVQFGHVEWSGVGRDSFFLPRREDVYSLDKGWEPLDEGKSFAAVAIGDDAAEGVDGALVEAKVGPGDKPAELDEDPGRLVAQKTEYVGDTDLQGGNQA